MAKAGRAAQRFTINPRRYTIVLPDGTVKAFLGRPRGPFATVAKDSRGQWQVLRYTETRQAGGMLLGPGWSEVASVEVLAR